MVDSTLACAIALLLVSRDKRSGAAEAVRLRAEAIQAELWEFLSRVPGYFPERRRRRKRGERCVFEDRSRKTLRVDLWTCQTHLLRRYLA